MLVLHRSASMSDAQGLPMKKGESLAAASSKPARPWLLGLRTWPNEDPLSDACIRLTKCSDKAAQTLAWNHLPSPNQQAQLTAAVWRAALIYGRHVWSLPGQSGMCA